MTGGVRRWTRASLVELCNEGETFVYASDFDREVAESVTMLKAQAETIADLELRFSMTNSNWPYERSLHETIASQRDLILKQEIEMGEQHKTIAKLAETLKAIHREFAMGKNHHEVWTTELCEKTFAEISPGCVCWNKPCTC